MAEAGVPAAIVRMLNPDGTTAGTGFLLTADGLIATCAHVVAGSQGGTGIVRLQFLVSDGPREARIESWRDADREDVALLRLLGDVPAGAQPLRLRRAAGSAGHRMSTYGFPALMPTTGIWGYGVIGDFITDPAGVPLLQLTGTDETTAGFSGGPVIDLASGLVVGMVSSIGPPDEYQRLTSTAFATPTETLRAIEPRLRAADICPYRGLDSFDIADARFFFGRRRVTQRLIDAMQADPRFLAVLGPSGSGKSSVVRAGLLARLRDGALAGSSDWVLTCTRPSEVGADPDALAGLVAGRDADVRQVLVLDQFEELFSLPETTLSAWSAALERLIGSPGLSIVIVMRDDFYSHLAAGLPRLMNGWVVHSLANVPSELDRADLLEIIRGPADAVGLVVQPELEAAILSDTEAASPGGRIRSTLLPLIEFALTQLWRGQSDGILRESAYAGIGRVSGSLVRWADAAYASLDEPGRQAARRMFTLLTRLGDEASGTPPSRRRRRLDDVLGTAPAALSRQVLGAFVTARLLVVAGEGDGSTWIDIIHETLLVEWELLRSWLREDREFLNWRQGLETRLQFWDGHAEGDVDWLQGRELDRADGWLRARAADLDPLARQFIEGSLHARRQRQEVQAALERRADEERAEAERQRQIAETRELIESLRADADAAEAMLAFDQARALSDIVTVTGANLDRLGGEPLLSVQSALFTVVRTAKERLRLDGHAQPITAIAIDRAGAWVVSGSRDRTIRLWPLAGGAPVTLGSHDDEVRAVAVSPDGRYIASGGADGVIRLWHPDGTSFAAPLTGPADEVLALDICPVTGRIAAGCGDGLYLWRDIGAAPIAVRPAGASYVASVAFSPRDGALAVGCGNGEVWYLDDLDGSASSPLRLIAVTHSSFVSALRYSPVGDLLASASGDGTLTLTTAPGLDRLAELDVRSASHGFVTSLAFTPDGTGLVYGDEDHKVHLVDLAGREIHPAQLAGGAVYAVAVSPDATWIAGSGGAQGYVWDWLPSTPPPASAAVRPGVRVWDRTGCQAGPALAGHDFVATVAFTASGDAIVSAGGDRSLRIWARDGTLREVVAGAHDGGIMAVACSPAGFPLIASGGRDTVLRLFDLSGRPLGRPMAGHRADVTAVAFSPDGTLVASGSEDGTARLWSLDGQPFGAPIHFDGSSVLGLAFSPDGRLLAATGGDGAVRLCDRQGTPQAVPFRGHESHNWDVAFAPDGESILSCGHDRSVRRWDLRGQPIGKPMRAHTGGVRAGRYHPDGKMIVTAGEDGSVRVWTAEGGQLIRPLAGESGKLFALALSPDGRLAATGGEDGTVRIWQLGDWRDWLREGQARLAAHASYRSG